MMARLVGQKKAREMWFLSRLYSAQQAQEMGLVNTVVPLARLEAETGEAQSACPEPFVEVGATGLRADAMPEPRERTGFRSSSTCSSRTPHSMLRRWCMWACLRDALSPSRWIADPRACLCLLPRSQVVQGDASQQPDGASGPEECSERV